MVTNKRVVLDLLGIKVFCLQTSAMKIMAKTCLHVPVSTLLSSANNHSPRMRVPLLMAYYTLAATGRKPMKEYKGVGEREGGGYAKAA